MHQFVADPRHHAVVADAVSRGRQRDGVADAAHLLRGVRTVSHELTETPHECSSVMGRLGRRGLGARRPHASLGCGRYDCPYLRDGEVHRGGRTCGRTGQGRRSVARSGDKGAR